MNKINKLIYIKLFIIDYFFYLNGIVLSLMVVNYIERGFLFLLLAISVLLGKHKRKILLYLFENKQSINYLYTIMLIIILTFTYYIIIKYYNLIIQSDDLIWLSIVYLALALDTYIYHFHKEYYFTKNRFI